jgi:hypothetical protein
MLKSSLTLAAVLLAGCAGTQQAALMPPADSAPVASAAEVAVEPAPVAAVAAPPAEPAPVSTLVVADVTEAVAAPSAPVSAIAPAAMLDPYQCMVSWARGMQDAMAPWTMAAQRCEPRATQP